jgi:hypothetical protein
LKYDVIKLSERHVSARAPPMVNAFPFFFFAGLCRPSRFIKGDAVLTPFGGVDGWKQTIAWNNTGVREITQQQESYKVKIYPF